MSKKHEQTIQKILSGRSNQNIRFADLRAVMAHLGFTERVKGSHHIYTKSGIADIVNIQPGSDGKAKAYQVRQVGAIINRNQLA